MMIIPRTIQTKIQANLYKKKVIVLYGARRVGKTTLSKFLIDQIPTSKYINCELLQNKLALETTNSELLRSFIGNYQVVVLDEAQHINNIGLILKILVDTFPEKQIIATGSSSFDLSHQVSEPLTGRSRKFLLYPFSVDELANEYGRFEMHAQLVSILRFGLYPEVVNNTEDEAIEELNDIASNYLYKDILQFERLKRPELLLNLLRAIALQIGNELSYNELSKLLGENIHTLKRYIELLEKSFIIFRLSSFSRNLRKEIAKGQKIYFYDLGIRNAIIQNFNPLELRNDVGGLWENFCLSERIKYLNNHRIFANMYFWRTYDQKEIDYIEEREGKLKAFEFKYNKPRSVKQPTAFLTEYEGTSFQIVHNQNYLDFVS